MRTTLTLDPDVDAQLKQLARARGITFKEAVNSTLRRGLKPDVARKPYRVPARPMGYRFGDRLPSHVLTALDDAEFIRKRALGK
ncbi:MAG TPA: CopG family transcriptional regulator [Solirubrobacteraceae bacterium]|nr:CopG family transcriptional regulator [Solirubrobacteraceae bacterium]